MDQITKVITKRSRAKAPDESNRKSRKENHQTDFKKQNTPERNDSNPSAPEYEMRDNLRSGDTATRGRKGTHSTETGRWLSVQEPESYGNGEPHP